MRKENDAQTYPYSFHVHSYTISGNPLMVHRFEQIVALLLVPEPRAQVRHLRLKLVGDQDLMRQRRKVEVEVVGQLPVLQLVRLGEVVPNAEQVSRKRGAQVLQRGRANVVANDEEEQGAALGAVLGLLAEESEVDLEDGLEEPHVGALVEADLVLPEVDDEDFGGGEGEERGFALEVLGSMRQEGEYGDVTLQRTWSSPRSRPSVPSTSMTRRFIAFARHIQIPGAC